MPPYRRYENKQDRYEWPAGNRYSSDHSNLGEPSLVDKSTLWQVHNVPINEYQALMEAPPGEYGVMSERERESDWLLFQEKIDRAGLSNMERIVVDATVFGGLSLYQVGIVLARSLGRNRQYSKTHTRRLRDSGMAKLRKVFTEHDD